MRGGQMRTPAPTHYLLHVGEGRNLFYVIARRDGSAEWHIVKVFPTRAQAFNYIEKRLERILT